jgi:hypothetical protein
LSLFVLKSGVAEAALAVQPTVPLGQSSIKGPLWYVRDIENNSEDNGQKRADNRYPNY